MPKHAHYDADGNIILPGGGSNDDADEQGKRIDEEESPAQEFVQSEIEDTSTRIIESDETVLFIATDDPGLLWEDVEESPNGAGKRAREHMEMLRRQAYELRVRMHSAAAGAVREGAIQYASSAGEMRAAAIGIKGILHGGLASVWAFMRQPVWVPGRKRPKKYSRGSLFLLDIVRFGGTFAALFGILFISLNYASFWEIVRSRLDPLAQTELVQYLQKEADAGRQGALQGPAIAAKEGDLLSHLPLIGPPVNRLIIPKLGLNVPIVTPPNTNLLRQDWTALEEDIQGALQNGVVHYPGTAIAGQAGNFFITGHSSYYPFLAGKYKTVFARLHELSVGDEYWVYFRGDKHRYVVQEKKEVKPSDVKVLDQPGDQRLSTLMTCTPVGTTLRRLVIIAQEVDPSTGIAMHVGEHASQQQLPQVQVENLPI